MQSYSAPENEKKNMNLQVWLLMMYWVYPKSVKKAGFVQGFLNFFPISL